MADIVLKDRNGNDVTYEGIKTVTFDTPVEGVQSTFTEGVAVEGLEIVPDFSGGDMAITTQDGTLVKSATIKKPDTLTPENVRKGKEIGGVPGNFIGDTEEVVIGESEGATPLNFAEDDFLVVAPSTEGKVISRVTIEKPDNLLPENIAEGVDIAGIIGTLAAGGGAKVAAGTVTLSTAGAITVNHGLGIAPDFVIVWLSVTNSIQFACGFSSAFTRKYFTLNGVSGSGASNRYVYNENGTLKYSTFMSGNIDTGSAPYINNANENTFSAGSATYPFASNYAISWIAIGGLT